MLSHSRANVGLWFLPTKHQGVRFSPVVTPSFICLIRPESLAIDGEAF